MIMAYKTLTGVITSNTLDDLKVKRNKFYESISDMKNRYLSYFDELSKDNLDYIIPTFSDIVQHNDGAVSIEVTLKFDLNLRQDIFDDYRNSISGLWAFVK
jgi:hypothetical protein